MSEPAVVLAPVAVPALVLPTHLQHREESSARRPSHPASTAPGSPTAAPAVPGNTGSGGAKSRKRSRPYFGPTEPHSGLAVAFRRSLLVTRSQRSPSAWRCPAVPVLCHHLAIHKSAGPCWAGRCAVLSMHSNAGSPRLPSECSLERHRHTGLRGSAHGREQQSCHQPDTATP